MKLFKPAAFLFGFLFFVLGCTTTTATVGRDFDSSKIAQIRKDVTKTSEIRSLLGDPYNIESDSATDVKWLYSWAQANAHTSLIPFGSQTTDVDGLKKNLCLSIKDDIVVNYTYEEGPLTAKMH